MIPTSSSPNVKVSFGKTLNPKLLSMVRSLLLTVCECVYECKAFWIKKLKRALLPFQLQLHLNQTVALKSNSATTSMSRQSWTESEFESKLSLNLQPSVCPPDILLLSGAQYLVVRLLKLECQTDSFP